MYLLNFHRSVLGLCLWKSSVIRLSSESASVVLLQQMYGKPVGEIQGQVFHINRATQLHGDMLLTPERWQAGLNLKRPGNRRVLLILKQSSSREPSEHQCNNSQCYPHFLFFTPQHFKLPSSAVYPSPHNLAFQPFYKSRHYIVITLLVDSSFFK